MGGYSLISPEYNQASKNFPVATSIIELLSSMFMGTDYDINPYLNLFKYNRQDRIFASNDQQLAAQMQRSFRNSTAGEMSNTGFEMFTRSAVSYFLDDKGKAEEALRQLGSVTGANSYAFGTYGQSMADQYNNWNVSQYGNYSQALTNLMAHTYNMEVDPNLTRGQRAQILSGMLQTDPNLVRDYQQARQEAAKRGEDVDSTAFDKLNERTKEVTKSLEAFGEAANNWGRILKTDAADAMKRLGDLLGGSAYGSFWGNAQAASEMALNIKHVGGITGRGAENTIAMIQQAGTYLKQIGGPADTAVNVATYAMLQSAGMAGWRVTQEEADKNAIRMNAAFQTSEAAKVYAGGFSEYVRKFGNGENIAVLQQRFEEEVKKNGLTVRSMNQILGENYGFNDYDLFSTDGTARDLMARPNNFNMLAMRESRNEMLDKIAIRLGDKRFTAENIDNLSQRTNIDVLKYSSMSYEQRMDTLRRENINVTSEEAKELENFAADWGRRVGKLSESGQLGSFSGMESQYLANAFSNTHIQNVERMDEQRDVRTNISKQINGAGVVKVIQDYISKNKDFTLGELAVALGGGDLSDNLIDEAMSIKSTKTDRDNLVSNISQLKENDLTVFKENMRTFITKAHNETLTKEDKERMERYGITYDQETKTIHVKEQKLTEENLKKNMEEFKARKEEENKENRILYETYTKGADGKEKEGLELHTAKMKIAGHQAMLNLARDAINNQTLEKPEDIQKAKEYVEAIKSKNSERADTLFKELKGTKLGDMFLSEEAKEFEKMGMSKDQAGLAAAIAQGFELIMGQLKNVIKDGKSVNVNLTQ